MSQPQPTVVTLSTCPTGGWLMGNRHVLAAAIKDELGGEWEVALVWIAGLGNSSGTPKPLGREQTVWCLLHQNR